MNRYWSGLVAAGAVAATVALGAQSPQSQNPANTPPPDAAAQPGVQRAPTPPSAQTRTPSTVTVAGCVQNAPAPTASAAAPGAQAQGRAAAGPPTQRFVLSNATTTASGEASRGAVGTTGAAAVTYQLDGDAAKISRT
jgi:hypothetical protein